MDQKSAQLAIANFSARFLEELDKTRSVVSSPLSAEFVLALLTLGATDTSHAELLTALGIPDDDRVRSTFSEISSKLRSLQQVKLHMANKVVVREGSHELHPRLCQDARDVFSADIQTMDFTDRAAAAQSINSWVESNTDAKIKELFSEGTFKKDTAVVLVNALYFKGFWQIQFNPRCTSNQTFLVDDYTKISVPTMNMITYFKFAYSISLRATMLEMPYKGGEASMVFVLPDEVEGVAGVLGKLAEGYDLLSDVEQFKHSHVATSIPVFKTETEIDLTEVLKKLGIKSIFDCHESSLGNVLLNNKQPLFVSEAKQKAFIQVDEAGTEAAAASGYDSEKYCSMRKPKQFIANHPFLYLLKVGNTPLFMGVYRGT